MIDMTKASVKELLGLATRAEIDSNAAYLKLVQRVRNPLLKEKFQMLAFEENKHRVVLEKLYKLLFQGEEIQIPDKTDEALLPSLNFGPSSSLVEILFQAMKAEKSAEDFYAGLSLRVNEPQKKILVYLGRVEHSHYKMLESEYILAQEFEDYGEKDIDKVLT
jgi:rubrerythrin